MIERDMPSAASGTSTSTALQPASVARLGPEAGGSVTMTGAPVASAISTTIRRIGLPRIGCKSLSRPRIREEAPAARIRMWTTGCMAGWSA